MPFGYLPIDDYLENNPWWDLAYDRGFTDHYYSIDYDNDGVIDNADWWWTNPNGDRIADTDQDFRANHYWKIVNAYNAEELDKIGTLATLSGVFGADYYTFKDNFYMHAWSFDSSLLNPTVLPHHVLCIHSACVPHLEKYIFLLHKASARLLR